MTNGRNRGMRTLCIALLFATSTAIAADREVRVMFTSNPAPLRTGDVIRKEWIVLLLFTSEPCPFGPEKNWHRYWQYRVGCWAPTTDGKFLTLDSLGGVNDSQLYWEIFPRGLLRPDGSVIVTEPDYDSRTFQNQVMLRIIKRVQESVKREEP